MIFRWKQLLIYIVSFFFFSYSHGQNLCPNPGFEQLSGCPNGPGEIDLAVPWTSAGALVDLFSFCHVNGTPRSCNDVSVPVNFAGTSAAHNGSAYDGFYTRRQNPNQRTYLQAPLTTPMVAGQLYRVSAFLKRSTASGYATNRIGFSFSTAALTQTANAVIPITPQLEITTVIADTANWTPFNAYYKAVVGEAFITIGNFRVDGQTSAFNFLIPPPDCAAMNNSAFYYIDDIVINRVIEQLSVTGDTLICTGESTQLTGITNTSGWWSLATNPNDTLASVNNVISISPVASTTYLWNGFQSSYTVTVSVTSPPIVSLPNDTTICEESSVILDATTPGCTYSWSTGENTSQISASDSGMYVVAVNNGSCIVRDTFNLALNTSPDVELPGTATVCAVNDELVMLNAGPGTSYVWLPNGDTTAAITVSSEGVYSVIVTHASGCTKTGESAITESCRETIFIPKAFTPNSDGKNDLFFADGTNVENYKIIIFNRWGQPIFNSSSLGVGGAWDGSLNNQPAPVGLYSYQVSYDAILENGRKKKYNKGGYLFLIR